MNTELSQIAQRIAQARTPEEVFGELNGSPLTASLKQVYHQIVKVTHPDLYSDPRDRSLAQAAFISLTGWYERAEEKIRAGAYGKDTSGANTIILRTPRGIYTINADTTDGEIFNCYTARFEEHGHIQPVTLKIARDVHDNDLAQNEARVLRILQTGQAARKFAPYLPRLLESFLYEEDGIARQVNAFACQTNAYACRGGWVSLAQVRAAYPDGLDPKDAAWIWRRLLVALGFAHVNAVIHGAVLPGNVFILPEQHGLRLENWAYAVHDPRASGEIIPAIAADYEDWYPDEVRNSEPPVCATDIAMSARCVIDLLGGDPVRGTFPARVPYPMQMFLKSCILPGKRARPQDAWGLMEDFDELLKKLWGERKFHPFVMR